MRLRRSISVSFTPRAKCQQRKSADNRREHWPKHHGIHPEFLFRTSDSQSEHIPSRVPLILQAAFFLREPLFLSIVALRSETPSR